MKITKESYFVFSGGEVHCKLPEKIELTGERFLNLVCLDYTMNGLMALCQYKEVLDREQIKVGLTYPYLPYARQDRVMTQTEPFSLKTFCNIINAQKFESVTVFDPHSDVGIGLIDRSAYIPQWHIVQTVVPKEILYNPNVVVVSPDAGAYKKVSKLITNDERIAIGVKHRDDKGTITGTKVFGNVEGRDCLMVDDICDGGRTFIELAKELKEQGANKIYLYVTHGIFSRGFEELKENIDHIYTTNSFPVNYYADFVTVKDIV